MTGLSWGEGGHKFITQLGVEWSAEPLRSMMMPYLDELKEASMDPDRRKSEPGNNNESIRHYIDIDALSPYPFTDFPHERSAAEKKYGKVALENEGIVPWAIEESFDNLVIAWKNGDSDWLRWVGDLAHYVGDTHQPFHTTANFDGQKTGNNGIHALFESVLFDSNWKDEYIQAPTASSGGSIWMPIGGAVAGGAAGFMVAGPPGGLIGALVGAAGGLVANLLMPNDMAPIIDPLEAAFDIVPQSFQHLDTLTDAHTLAQEYRQTNPKFYSTFWDEGAKTVMIEQINRGGHVLSRYLMGAWIQAGRPTF
jgi:hypothetical protein